MFEEGINSVVTVRDFTTIFDTFAQFEESVLTAKMSAAAEEVIIVQLNCEHRVIR